MADIEDIESKLAFSSKKFFNTVFSYVILFAQVLHKVASDEIKLPQLIHFLISIFIPPFVGN